MYFDHLSKFKLDINTINHVLNIINYFNSFGFCIHKYNDPFYNKVVREIEHSLKLLKVKGEERKSPSFQTKRTIKLKLF